MLAMACPLTAMTLANGPYHHESSQYPQSLGINLQRAEESWRLSFLSTNEWYWKTRDHHTCLHARPYMGDFWPTIRIQGIKVLTMFSSF